MANAQASSNGSETFFREPCSEEGVSKGVTDDDHDDDDHDDLSLQNIL